MSQSLSPLFVKVWMVVVILTALYLWTSGVNTYHYSEDEAMHVRIAQSDSLKSLFNYSLYEAHPPLGHIVRHFWIKISGEPWFVRGLSLLFAIAMLPLYYRIGQLLNNETTGICCAALVAFSNGISIQSYIVRNYSMFMFLLSAAMYSYLRWQKSAKNSDLFFYAVSAMLASLTHFSAIFAIFAIALYQLARMFLDKASSMSKQAKWVWVNSVITIVATGTYCIWSMHGTVLPREAVPVTSYVLFIFNVLLNPVAAASYLYSCVELLPIVIFCLLLPAIRRKKELKNFLILTATALGVGMVVLAANLYFPAGNRQGVWIAPFLLPATGWLIACALEELAINLDKQYPFPWLKGALIILFVMGAVINWERKFTDETEYQMTEEQWQQSLSYFEGLNASQLVIMARDDAVLFTNLYPYLDSNAINGKVQAGIIPFYHTHIVFNPYERRFYSSAVLLNTLEEAQKQHMLDSADTLVFMKPIWSVYNEQPLLYLLACPIIPKKVISFPPFSLSSASPDRRHIVFMEIAKKDFMEQVIAKNGKAHYCLSNPYGHP